ncbi:MAG: hypothetical protein DRP87_01145 [Spirochaetes bacterium]|nr:MAG: hypothetical protein DRP87_01145 [Spirochaetota bacterium]
MICEFCEEREAVIHVKQIVGYESFDVHLCEDCAHKRGISNITDKREPSLSSLLSGLISSDSERDRKSCPKCGSQYFEIRETGRLGCTECFVIFDREIGAFLEEMTGSKNHMGKYPKKLKAYKTLLIDRQLMKEKLSKAVKNEDYELAAYLRDRINELEISEEKNGSI